MGSPEMKLKWQFQLYDKDRSGNINEEEFVQIFVQIYEGEDGDHSKTEQVFTKGFILEFKIPSFREEKEAVIEKAKDMFAELDDSGDGEVSQVKLMEWILVYPLYLQICLQEEFIEGCMKDEDLVKMLSES